MSQEPVHAVLAPPDLRRFREITGVGDAKLEVSFQGWSKLAVLTEDRVFMFPRRGRDAQLLHGARVCEVLSSLGVVCVPHVAGDWSAETLSAGPFVAFERRPGVTWDAMENAVGVAEVERMLRSLGSVIATWHRIDVTDLPSDLRVGASFAPKQTWLSAFLDPDRVEDAVDEVAQLLQATSAWSAIWRKALRELSTIQPVLIHGDVCENQLLVNGHGQVETVLDWDTAGIGHPLHDFDFGEWGLGIFRWEAQFARLRRAMWESYRAGRPDAALPGPDEVHLLFTLTELAYFEQQNVDGANDDWGTSRLAQCRAAIAPATEVVMAR